MGNLKERVTKIIDNLNEGIHEREETIAVSFLAALSNQNVFLFGPPGTAKSLIARRLSHAFETNGYFEYLMHRFSTPEEVFGPVSITELKKDNFLRKTEGFLPQSDFAFLDEIWKSSPAILNTLLTITNEKLFRNGTQVEPAPLKALIAASNETPPLGQGLEALYDRFLVRLKVLPMEIKNSFAALLQSHPTNAELELPDDLVIKHEEWRKWCDDIHSIKLSEETLNVIHDIRLSFEEKGEELDMYVSDRRWQKAAILLKAAAFFCDRKETNLVDTLLLRHCLWTTKDNYVAVVKIVEDAVRNLGFETGFNLAEIDAGIEKFENEINKKLYYNADVYDVYKVKNLSGKGCFKHTIVHETNYNADQSVFIPSDIVKRRTEKIHPIDEHGKELDWIRCYFEPNYCRFEIRNSSGWTNYPISITYSMLTDQRARMYNDKKHFQYTVRYPVYENNDQTIFIPVDKMKSIDEYFPAVDENGNKLDEIKCCFDSQGTCSISYPSKFVNIGGNPIFGTEFTQFTPEKDKIKFNKGDKRLNVNSKLIESLKEALLELTQNIEEITEQIATKLNQFKTELETPFVPENTLNIAIESVEAQLEDMKLRRKDCDRLKSSIG